MRGLSFRVKLELAFLLLAVVLVGGAVAASRYAATTAAKEKIERDFARTSAQLERLIKSRMANFDDVAAAALSDPLFRSQLGKTVSNDDDMGLGDDAGANEMGLDSVGSAGDDNPLAEAHGVFASAELPMFQRYPLLVIVNTEGTLLFSKGELARYGGSVKAIPLVAKALKEQKSVGIWGGADANLRAQGLVPEDAGGDMFLMMASRIATRDGVLGAVIAGESLRQGLLGELESSSNAFVALRIGDKLLHRADPASEALLAEVVASLEAPRTAELRTQGGGVIATSARIPSLQAGETLGEVFLFRRLAQELRPFNDQLQSSLGVVGVVGLLFSLVVATLLARRLTRPLGLLDKAVRKVRAGDLTVKVPVESRDEIGSLAQSFNEMTVGLQQRDQIKATFKRYLAPAVVEELIQNPDKLNLGGEDKELSILFSDLVGFTSLSEGRKASELVALLNEYFDEVGQAIVRRGGTLDKFAGDSVMCFFGAPLDQPDHRARALLSALDHLQVVDDVQQRWRAMGRPNIDCRIGVNSGPVVVGNIGSRDGQDYTVIGDAVNLASRLEGANKEYGTRLMVSQDTLRGCEGLVEVRELDSLRVKGKAIPVRVFEVLGAAGSVSDETRQMLGVFAAGLTAYRAGAFSEAKVRFAECLSRAPKDGPSATFLARCEHFLVEPPEAPWDGVWKMTSK